MRHSFAAAARGLVVATSFLASACSSVASPSASVAPPPPASATADPSEFPRALPTAATQPPASAEPATPPSAPEAFVFGDVLAVSVEGLAVREGPSTDSPLLFGLQATALPKPSGRDEVRLGRGDFVSVELGPLPVGDATWYLVRPAENGQVGFSSVSWQPAGADGGSYPGWIASAVGEREHVALHQRSDPSEIVGGGEPMSSGSGDWVSEPQPRHDLFSVRWAVAPSAGPCGLIVQLIPEMSGAAHTVVDIVTNDIAQGALSGAEGVIEPSWGEPTANDWTTFVVSVQSTCPWTVSVQRVDHD
jgi:hypothetical protein